MAFVNILYNQQCLYLQLLKWNWLTNNTPRLNTLVILFAQVSYKSTQKVNKSVSLFFSKTTLCLKEPLLLNHSGE